MKYINNYSDLKKLKSRHNLLRTSSRSALIKLYGITKYIVPRKHLRLIYCHYVFDDQVQSFENIIKKLMASGRFVDTDYVLDVMEGRKIINDRCYHISFDDGFSNILTNALPILKKYNIPCLFFIPTGFISASQKETENFCLEITRYGALIKLAEWDEIYSISNSTKLIEFASHTRTHARLSLFENDKRALISEILHSKSDIENNINKPCRFISWPYGGISDIGKNAEELIRFSNYKAAFGAFRGQINYNQTNSLRIPRHHFEPQWDYSHIDAFANGMDIL